jgi:trehalose/maltose hydrolase-like predicted phosphorylase
MNADLMEMILRKKRELQSHNGEKTRMTTKRWTSTWRRQVQVGHFRIMLKTFMCIL